MKYRTALFLVISAAMGLPARAQEDVIERHLFPPELVMAHQQDIGLTEEQREKIKLTMQQAQSDFLDFQWDLQVESRKMGELLEASPVDEGAVLEQADRVMALEREIKKTQLSLLIRIKNTLTESQQDRLMELRPRELKPRPHPRRPF